MRTETDLFGRPMWIARALTRSVALWYALSFAGGLLLFPLIHVLGIAHIASAAASWAFFVGIIGVGVVASQLVRRLVGITPLEGLRDSDRRIGEKLRARRGSHGPLPGYPEGETRLSNV